MNRDELAFAIFLKRVPNEPLLESNLAWFISRAQESYDLADLFLRAKREAVVCADVLERVPGVDE